MSKAKFTSFQRHLAFYAAPPSRTHLTVYSITRASLALGLDFPFALAQGISLRFYWSPSLFRSPEIATLRGRQPTHLQHVKFDKPSYTPDELVQLYEASPERESGWYGWMDRTHFESFANWAKRADGRVTREELELFQKGEWQGMIEERRRGRDHVVPLRYGGPIIVSAHSWFVRKLFGVRVYEAKGE